MSVLARPLIATALLFAVGCSSDETQNLGPRDGAAEDAQVAGMDAAVGADASTPLDAATSLDAQSVPDADTPPPPPDAGMQACRTPQDCFQALGRPPPCPGGDMSTWQCQQGQCTVDCGGGGGCRNDCECDFALACIQGSCQPADRRNFCCDNPDCPSGSMCVEANGQRNRCPETPPPTDGGVPSDAGPPPVVPVGDACMSAAQCNGGFCLDAASGFVDGYCTQACGPGGSMCPGGSVCRDFGPRRALCLEECMTPTDCRAGYQCVRLGTAPERVCFPEPPSSGNPNGDPVGSACVSDNDCVTGLSCLTDQDGWPGGYCTVPYCDVVTNPCPAMSACYALPGSYSLCLEECPAGGTQSICRMNYYCLGPSGGNGGCVPN